MPEEIRIKPSTLAVGLLLIFIIGVIVWQAYYAAPPPTPVYKYTTGLTVKFRIYDAGRNQLVAGDGAKAEFYPAGTNPFARVFTVRPLTSASYDSVNGYWTVPLDAGTYVVLVSGVSGAYPEMAIVKVPGTNSEDLEVWLQPSQINIYSRAIVYSSVEIYAWVEGTGWTPAAEIDVTHDKWRVTFAVIVSENGVPNGVIKAGRIYMSKITGLTPTSASLDGVVAGVNEDIDASDDGMSGFYVVFPEWGAGEIHRLDVIFEKTATISTPNTLTFTLFEHYECLRPALRAGITPLTEEIDVVS